jgi:hypothetical protein
MIPVDGVLRSTGSSAPRQNRNRLRPKIALTGPHCLPNIRQRQLWTKATGIVIVPDRLLLDNSDSKKSFGRASAVGTRIGRRPSNQVSAALQKDTEYPCRRLRDDYCI